VREKYICVSNKEIIIISFVYFKHIPLAVPRNTKFLPVHIH
jgi:hypothetical protein